MNTQISTNLPADPLARVPWHPMTLEDIREVIITDLPHIDAVILDRGYLYHQGARLSGTIDSIKEKMEGAFLHWPNMCFARDDNFLVSVVMFEKLEQSDD